MKSKTKKTGLNLKKFPRRIVLKFQDSLNLPYTSGEAIMDYLIKNEVIPMKKLLAKYPGIKLNRLFTSVEPGEILEAVKKARELNSAYVPPDFLTYCVIDCPYKVNVKQLVEELKKSKNVSFAYLESVPAPPPCAITGTNPRLGDQGYLDAAPKGIDARYAWTKNGGCGEGRVQFIDIEYAWVLNHEDIRAANVGFLWGDSNCPDYKDHGTSVLGVILMQDNNEGGLGITPGLQARARVISQISSAGRHSIPDAIASAISNLDFGDILLLEIQVYDPLLPAILRPPEIEQAIFDKIELATNLGIIVIEAAGNGDESRGYKLDDCTDINGRNILDRTSTDFKESGAIIVGAASATIRNGKHGKTRTSNYGNRIDCYAWGKKVFTADDPANYPVQTPPYTGDFSGTSSASAIIAGAAIAVQSIAEAAGKSRIGPLSRAGTIGMRDILSNPLNGTASRNAIGIMPDLKAVIDNVIPRLP
jgi:Subtilase family